MKNSSPQEVSNESSVSQTKFTSILLIILIVLNAFGLYFLMGNSVKFSETSSFDPIGIKKALLEIEYEKVWGKENYELQTKAQVLSLADPQNPYNIANLKKYIESFSGGIAPTPTDSQSPAIPEWSTLPADKIQSILSWAAIEWNKTADILVVEYSDMECPFCVRQYHETQLWKKLEAQYKEKVQFAFKNNRWVNHEWTEAKALGALCAQKLGGDKAYVAFYTTVMDGTTQAGGVYPVDKLKDAASKAWVDIKSWQTCLDTKELQSTFASQTAEATSLGLGGTPGTLILNLKTGKYATVEGAYPYETFTAKIDELLK